MSERERGEREREREERERERERDRQTDRQTETETETQRENETDRVSRGWGSRRGESLCIDSLFIVVRLGCDQHEKLLAEASEIINNWHYKSIFYRTVCVWPRAGRWMSV